MRFYTTEINKFKQLKHGHKKVTITLRGLSTITNYYSAVLFTNLARRWQEFHCGRAITADPMWA